ncbi:hypothetical protein [Hyphomicrobium sp. NDB2Meth4]|uniref:hypothetical protein n=1 Tax=Hyphomicrobium sp. NDB2Meth4 TaxID=1892846 RepID=UPI000931F67D|nr:hypothetical protein [Hyphomicrobium sp. NDB2Meth4]
MHYTQADYDKLARKLIEVFSFQTYPREKGFMRYWPLAGPVETFSEKAVGELEQQVAKSLHSVMEGLLRELAPKSSDPYVATAVAEHLGEKTWFERQYERWNGKK